MRFCNFTYIFAVFHHTSVYIQSSAYIATHCTDFGSQQLQGYGMKYVQDFNLFQARLVPYGGWPWLPDFLLSRCSQKNVVNSSNCSSRPGSWWHSALFNTHLAFWYLLRTGDGHNSFSCFFSFRIYLLLFRLYLITFKPLASSSSAGSIFRSSIFFEAGTGFNKFLPFGVP